MVKVVTVHTPQKPKKSDLKSVYDICNRIFKSERLFYNHKDIEHMKENKKYIFIK